MKFILTIGKKVDDAETQGPLRGKLLVLIAFSLHKNMNTNINENRR